MDSAPSQKRLNVSIEKRSTLNDLPDIKADGTLHRLLVEIELKSIEPNKRLPFILKNFPGLENHKGKTQKEINSILGFRPLKIDKYFKAPDFAIFFKPVIKDLLLHHKHEIDQFLKIRMQDKSFYAFEFDITITDDRLYIEYPGGIYGFQIDKNFSSEEIGTNGEQVETKEPIVVVVELTLKKIMSILNPKTLGEILKGARNLEHYTNKIFDGYEILDISPESVIGELGVQDHDVLTEIGGKKIGRNNQIEIYKVLVDEALKKKDVAIEGMRDETPLKIIYRISD